MQLVLSSAGVSYGERIIFSDLSLVVESGEMVAVTGPSGSGKSTLLGVLSGLQPASSGEVSLLDISSGEVYRGSAVSRFLGWIPQGNNSLPSRSVLDNAALGGLSRGMCRREASAEAVRHLERVSLAEHAGQRADSLSGGELQRLAFARALCARRPFLFADEPTGSLDSVNTKRTIDVMRQISAAGVGICIATHDSVVADRCSRVVWVGK